MKLFYSNCIALLALCLGATTAQAQRDRNYYTQVMTLSDSTQVRILADDVQSVTVVRSDDYSRMTAREYINFSRAPLDSVRQLHQSYDYSQWWYTANDGSTLYLPSNALWNSVLPLMEPYYKGNGKTIVKDIKNMRTANDSKTLTVTYNPWQTLRESVVSLPNNDNVTDVVSSQPVADGTVVVADKMAANAWLRDLEFSNWYERIHVMQTTTGIDTIIYTAEFDNMVCFNASLDSACVKTVEGTTFAVIEPINTQAKPAVMMQLPQPLATAYDFYCVLVPENAPYAEPDSLGSRPNALNFLLNYSANGKLATYNFSKKFLDEDTDENPKSQNMTTAFTNDTTKVDTLYLGRFTFPEAYDWFSDSYRAPTLQVTCPISVFNKSQMAAYTRTIRLAAVLMRPVKEENQ
jgi:hypothetical protein